MFKWRAQLIDIRIHSSRHLEVKINYLIPNQNSYQKDIDYYIFSPPQLNVSSKVISRDAMLRKFQAHARYSSPEITIDELLSDNTRLSSNIYAAHSYQERNEWRTSKNLLTQLNIKHSIKDDINKNINTEASNVRVLENYVKYQIAYIRQLLHDNEENINIVQKECEILFSLSKTVINQSKHPLFLQAHVFAGYCLNKADAVATQRRQLTRMNVPLPHYFTTINKELINDNTTQL